MAISKPNPATNIDLVGILFYTRRDPDTGAISPVLGRVEVTRIDAAGAQIDEIRGTFADLSPTQQTQITNTLASIRTYGTTNLLG